MDEVLASVKIGAWQSELRRFPMPDVQENTGLMKVAASGVCGADVATYAEELRTGPFVMGHENVGYIAKIGKLATAAWGLKEGDRVAAEGYQVCGHCESCLSGYFGYCPTEAQVHDQAADPASTHLPDFQPSRGGGYAQYLYLRPNTRFHKIPNHVTDEQAALAIPFANGWQWAYTFGGVGPGKTVLIEGPGQQGLGCLVASKEAGADLIIVSGLARDARRLEVARLLGADHTVDVEHEDLEERVLQITNGRGVDVTIDVATGTPDTVFPAIRLLRPHGTLVIVPSPGNLPDFPLRTVTRKSLSVRGALGHHYNATELAIRTIASGRYSLDAVTSHRYGLAGVHQAICDTAGQGDPNAVHVTVVPDLL